MRKSNPNAYMNPRQYAATVKLTRQRINQLLLAGKIPGAIRIGAMWAIPSKAVVSK